MIISRIRILHGGCKTISRTSVRKLFCSRMVSSYKDLPPVEKVNQLQYLIKDGDHKKAKELLSEIPDVDMPNKHGWTPLMLNARYGNPEIQNILLEKGARLDLVNPTGQTAPEIAAFWNNKEVYDGLTEGNSLAQTEPFFTRSPVNRVAENRVDDAWIQNAMQQPGTVFLVTRKGIPMAISQGLQKLSVLLRPYDNIAQHIATDLSNVLFLGVHERTDAAVFSVDVADKSKEEMGKLFDGASVITPYPDFLWLSRDEAAICGHAYSLCDWHRRYTHCPSCGSKTVMREAGYKRKCTNEKCLTQRGIHNSNYPRVDPTVICTVVSPDRKMCLLGRKPSFPPGMYSCLAGFVEPGEGIEDTCVREVQEEVGLVVSAVQYVASQPWPLPSSLMLGCEATVSELSDIKIDKEELEDARWFSRDECVGMLTMHHPDQLWIPPPQALANQLVHSWVLRTAFSN